MAVSLKTLWVVLVVTFFTVNIGAAETGRRGLQGHVPAVVHRLVAWGVMPDTNELTLAIGLPLRNHEELSELIGQLYDPASTNFHRFIQPPEFTARFGPTEEQYLAVQDFVRSNGFIITGRHGNHLVLDVQARAVEVERAFRITLRTYRHPTENRDFFSPDTEPSVPTNLPVSDMWGLSDFGRPKPLSHLIDPRKMAALRTTPLGGSGFEGFYAGNDFRNAYLPGTPLTGAGQSVALLQFSSYFKSDITNYENFIGRTNFVDVTNVVLAGGTPSSSQNNETALDIEMAIAMAPQLSHIIVYEEKSVMPNSILSRMANDNLARQLSSSWSWTGGPSVSVDAALMQMIAQGQSYFQASGDSDAYTGNETLDNASQTTAPMDTTNVTCVGGTTLNMNGTGASWSAEKVWNYTPIGAPYLNEGSGGGVSAYYTIPGWQLKVDTNVSQGSGTFRNIPDVALTGDGITVVYTTSGTSITNGAAGTSCAAPLWAGFCALLNQQSVASSGNPVGFLNPALYSLAAGTNYANCFHDIITGNNIGTNTANQFYATNGYDLCTGLGTPNGVNLINVLAPRPAFLTQPNSPTVTNGANVTITAIPLGAPQWSFQWLLNGTNLPASGNISGVNTNTLTITTVTSANAGNYSLVFTNPYGAITSSVAVLTVGFGPALSAQPTNLTLLTGSTAVFNSVASGSAPLSFQWQKNGTNLVNGTGIAGATTNILTLTGITTNNTGVYAVVITNLFGTASSTGATLTVVVPPTIAASSVTNRTVECGGNVTNSVAVAGTLPLAIQWSVDAVPVNGATGTSFTVANIHPSSHTISVVVTNLYGTITSNAVVTAQDTQAPVVTLNGAAVLTNELGDAFIDPGATANDVCAGAVAVTTNGTVNVGVVGTDALIYTASDGNGNTGTNMRIVLVRDTTPPTITWSFTNLTLVANASCQAAMTNVTGTNFILASDASGTMIITQRPTNNAPLSIGTNLVVIAVMDLSSNAAFSTNTVIVLDQTPPTIALLGAAQMTNELGHAFADPGIVAADTCTGAVLVTTNGAVNINATGTNTLTYIATDHSGNTNGVVRTVIVQDTTPPTITWSFTNVFLPLNTNCAAVMPDMTGTNFIVATDLSNPLTYAQSIPTNTALPLGTNVVVITVTDSAGNAAFSTNLIMVTDTNLPVLASQPQSLTNDAGSAASFTVTATACAALTYQWLFNNVCLTNQNQNSLTLSNVTAIQAGNYSVVVTSSGGAITSDAAVLTVNRLVPGLTLVSSENPAGYRDTLNFIAGVSPTNATGAIQFLTNGAAFDLEQLMLGAAASTNLAALPRGTNLIAAVYSGDDTYLSLTNFLCQIVTNHPPLVAPVFYTLTAGLNLEIPVASLATNWSDADGDPLSIAAISVSTNSVTITNTTPDLFYADPNYVNDQFTCFITDGFGGTNSEVVTILVMPQTNSTPGIAGVSIQPGGVTLQLTGRYGSTYILQGTTNLLSGGWQSLTTNQPGVTGAWIYTDTQFTDYPQQFYRLELAP